MNMSSVSKEPLGAHQCLLPVFSTHEETRGCPLDRKLKDLETWVAVLISSPSQRPWLRKEKEEMRHEQLVRVSRKN